MLRERTLREARIAARLRHPNVVTVFDVIEDGDQPWIVMELGPARSLRDIVEQDGPLRSQQAAEIGLQVLAALQTAHRIGVLHRDVKPGNVLIDADGRAVLADFGIARAQDSPTLTASGVVLGSPSYIAPERARGEQGGPPSDLWSLGATLYSAVEGRPPYDRPGALATLMAVAVEEPDPPRLAGPLWPIIRGLLRRDPEQRLEAAAVEQMLRRIANANDTLRTAPFPASAGPDDLSGKDHAGQELPREKLIRAERTLAFHPLLTERVAPLPATEPVPHLDSVTAPAAAPDKPVPDAAPPAGIVTPVTQTLPGKYPPPAEPLAGRIPARQAGSPSAFDLLHRRTYPQRLVWGITALAAALVVVAVLLWPGAAAHRTAHTAQASRRMGSSPPGAARSAPAAPGGTTRRSSPAGPPITVPASQPAARGAISPARCHQLGTPASYRPDRTSAWRLPRLYRPDRVLDRGPRWLERFAPGKLRLHQRSGRSEISPYRSIGPSQT